MQVLMEDLSFTSNNPNESLRNRSSCTEYYQNHRMQMVSSFTPKLSHKYFPIQPFDVLEFSYISFVKESNEIWNLEDERWFDLFSPFLTTLQKLSNFSFLNWNPTCGSQQWEKMLRYLLTVHPSLGLQESKRTNMSLLWLDW